MKRYIVITQVWFQPLLDYVDSYAYLTFPDTYTREYIWTLLTDKSRLLTDEEFADFKKAYYSEDKFDQEFDDYEIY